MRGAKVDCAARLHGLYLYVNPAKVKLFLVVLSPNFIHLLQLLVEFH